MTNLLANPFEQIVAQPRVVPQAVERVIQAGVSADYLNRRRLDVCRGKLIEAQLYLSTMRQSDYTTAADRRRAENCVCFELDRVWEAQCMVSVAYVPVPPASVLTEILS
jgi:hypothetical protein